ncbi:T9SS type A sorting domain-containing protein [Flavobacterium sp. Fl-77]|uniref:T9SS type A sorting domain-containing protein n=1 Tax=Flavobacterium flavipigmentatum TaxID=2893884 RepID=A0AAJ2SKG8_9FLAO|nr:MULTISPECIES: T9SS type A sorting domain-containing protein [unclassified Flavobacterium]MDX6183215.1 T9SS type A sorting domain-containing protein [Flavobacterium sp. Fl-33]MDX6187613.1 T9SS type A sorting domain-containing protein [Flavobacterium sp. Fl-77]UFH40372.1 T9SS type A sorting domain-containing protein [Flavobacterium sp. F-70]
MKHFYAQIKNFINIALFLGIFLQSYIVNSQTTLSAGDIIFTGYDSNPSPAAGDVYSFVLLTNISAGTVISFTDRGYFGAGVWQTALSTEATVSWTSGTAIPVGTEIMIKGLTASTYDPNTAALTTNGTVTLTEGTPANGLSLSTVGDQIIAFQGGTGIPESSGVTFISGLHYFYCSSGTGTSQASWDDLACADGPNSSVIPVGLVGGTSSFYTGTLAGNVLGTSGKFNGTGAPFANAAGIRAGVMNQANWTLSNTTPALSMPSGAAFLGVAPTITANPPNRTICVGSNTTFSISANDATSYQWQVNTGSGFTNISNAAPYSGATTTTLTITAATAGMSGYLYRCVATGAGSATSNAGTLTVSNTIVTTTSQTNVSCKGGSNGSAILSASGGIAPYTYSWSPSGGTASSASGLSAQTYTVTVTDNIACTTTHTVIITEPVNVLVATPASQTNVSCFGGSNGTATVAPTGGTPGYSYAWSPSGGTAATATGLSQGTYTVTVTDANSCTATQSFTITQPTALSVTPATQTNVSCFGGSNGAAAINTPTGGAGGYTYNWTPGTPTGDGTTSVTGLTAGTWTCTVTDANSCTTTQSFTVTQPSAITVTPSSQTNVSCFGGSNGAAAINTPTGGAGGYTYDWTPGTPTGDGTTSVTGLTAGTWTCTVTDANGCTRTQNFTVTQPSAITVTPSSQTNVSCFGGSNGAAAINTPTGGAGGYTYDWTPGTPTGDGTTSVTGLTPGTWTCTVTDANGCTRTQNFTVTQPSAITVTPLSQTNVSCFGGSNGAAAINTPTGGAGGYTYNWTPGNPTGDGTTSVTGLTAGTWTCTVTDANGCTRTQNFTVTQTPVITVTPSSQTNVSCFGGSNGAAAINTPTGGAGGYTYNWTPGNPTGDGTTSVTGLTAGTWTCTVTDANGCTRTQNFTVTQPSAISVTPASQTNIACNGGSTGAAAINTPTGGAGGYTYDWTPGTPTGDGTTSVTGLSAGTYTVTVTDANGCTATQSFTVTQPAALAVTPASQTNVSCFGGSNGSATVSVSGGTSAYTYAWSPSGGTAATASGLSAGTYTVTVTDANACTATQSFTITEPSVLAVTPASQTNVSCFGGSNGSATVSVSGGISAYTYAWSPSGGTAATASGLSAGTYTVTVTDANSCTTTQSFTITQPAALSVTPASQTNIACNGGSTGAAAINTPTGGVGGYTYDWTPGTPTGDGTTSVTGLSAGTYTVTVTDANGCIATQSFTVTQPSALVATPASQTNVSCFGGSNGSATVSVSGGTSAYTYAWSPSGGTAATASGLIAGTYTVTVTDANACTATQSFTITQPSALAVTPASQTNVSCFGGSNGSATVSVSGGTSAYTYAWSPSGGTAATASGLSAGTYTVTVTDANACIATQSFTITEPPVLAVTPASQTNVSCFGGSNGSATVSVSGGISAYTYAWSPSGGTAATASGLSAGTYTVTVTDANSCTTTQSFTITQPAALSVTPASQTNIACNGGSTGAAAINTPTGGVGGYTYDWSPGTPTGDGTTSVTGLIAGTYTVTVTDANGCTATQSFTVTQPSALVATPASQTNVSCFGGSNGSATVSVSGGTSAYTYAWSPSGGTAATASGLSAGTYTVTVTDANGCTATQSFVLTEPNVLTTTIASQTNVSCFGGSNGSATVSVSGGTSAYTYSWSPTGGTAATATGLSAGTYTVTITDANGCITTQNIVITEPSILDATTTQVNVTCPGETNGSATALATGGTGAYTYAWSPSGGNSATATGLAAGTYTVVITDANGCQVTKSVTIVTTPDTTAPVPDVTNLPAITSSCGIVSTEIPVPTATDNCIGSISATTVSPLNYNAVGTYVITWSYNDGNGNVTTQNQTINIVASPLDQVTFGNATRTYDGTIHTVQVANLPAGASVNYTTTPATGTANGATNAGTYTLTATVSPSVSTPNCAPITLTANLTINKAAQQITFGPLADRTLGVANTFNLNATSNSGLPVRYTYTYTSGSPAATVSTSGLVTMLTSGQITITAHQDGNANYLPAPDVSQVLVIKNNDVSVMEITIGDQTYVNPATSLTYVMECGETNVDIAIVNQTGATITPSANFMITPPKPGIYTQNVAVTSQDGSATANYTLTVEKPFGFFDIVKQKFNNVLLVNNNPQTNGGYQFVAYQWFKNGQLVGTGQYYSVGDDVSNTLDPTADYSVKMTTKDGKVLQTCATKITLQKSVGAKLYPNPSQAGKMITVEADFPEEELENMHISLYTVSGQLIKTVQSSSVKTEIQLPPADGNMYVVVVETANITKTLKVIVNK